MKLLIVESPAKAKTIAKYLDNKYTVRASVGHIRDLPKSNKKAIDIAGGFIPHYEIVKGKEKIVSELQTLSDKATEVLLATDPDREGEAIAWHIAEAVGLKKPQRVVFHEITKEAVEEAVLHPRHIDQNLRRAQEARRVLDRLVGYDLSGLIWKKVRYGLSAGRVQSPALRIIVEREREIKAFKPETFWVITADTETKKNEPLTLICSVESRDKKQVDEILAAGNKFPWAVKAVEETEAKRAARPPFITSTLQQTASSRLGFAPYRTMGIAQTLYEAGLITYMRTDSTTLSQNALGQISAVVEKKFGKDLLTLRTFTTKSKNAQEAHEAIRPSHFSKESAGNTPEQRKLYELIWQRAVASQMADARMLRTKVLANIHGAEIPDFSANGSRMIFPGWLLADPGARGEEVELPKVAQGDALTLKNLRSDEKQTEPPPRYTEAGLVKELEKRGIGRPSTYASIIGTIEKRGYTEKIGRSLKPTDVGEVVSTFLEENFTEYISDGFTAEMENELDEIADGKREYEKTLSDFYKPFSKAVKSKDKIAKLTNLGDAPAEFKCPVCGGPMEWKLSRGGKFMSCKKFPDCDGALTAEGKLLPKSDEPIGTDTATGFPIFVKNGRFGPYVQLGEHKKGSKEKPKMASIPKEIDPSTVTVEIAQKLLSLPRILGVNPKTGKEVSASRGRFGPYIVEDGDFRSLKTPDNPYDVTLERALQILSEEKKKRGFKKKIKTS